jgi:hypothetical protein
MVQLTPIDGLWEFDHKSATYKGPNSPNPIGMILTPKSLRSGEIEFKAKFTEITKDGCARAVLGRNPKTDVYFSIGIGGYGYAFVSDTFNGQFWKPNKGAGTFSQLAPGRVYQLLIKIDGQRATLLVDGVTVLSDIFPAPLPGNQVGVMAWDKHQIEFQDVEVREAEPSAFVIMKFGGAFDRLYHGEITEVCKKCGFKVVRADDIRRPGLIIQDILRGIDESDVVLAEITPANQNVFYELGYAHALQKRTILLSRKRKLPFDISGHRVIFYKRGKKGSELLREHLKDHFTSIKAETA